MSDLVQRQEYAPVNTQTGRHAAFVATLLVRVPQVLLAFTLALLIGFLVVSVVSRYFFKLGMPWSDEFARVLFAWIVMIGFALAVQERANVAVDILVEKAGPRVKRGLYILQDAAVLIFSCVFTYAAYITVQFASIQRLPALGITIGWLYSSCVVAGVLMIIYSVSNLIQSLRGRRMPPNYEASGDL